VYLRRPDGELYRAAVRRVPGLEGEPFHSRALEKEVVGRGLAALVQDASIDHRFAAAESILSAGVRSILAAPLLAADGCLGMIFLHSRARVRQFSEEDMALLVTLAAAAAAADIIESVIAEVRSFAGGTPQSDDLTALVLRYRGSS
jgi:GAF domain-containing protein